jgi:hypothetical protein
MVRRPPGQDHVKFEINLSHARGNRTAIRSRGSEQIVSAVILDGSNEVG